MIVELTVDNNYNSKIIERLYQQNFYNIIFSFFVSYCYTTTVYSIVGWVEVTKPNKRRAVPER